MSDIKSTEQSTPANDAKTIPFFGGKNGTRPTIRTGIRAGQANEERRK